MRINAKQQFFKPIISSWGITSFNQMKFEIANEFGVNLGAETTSRANGSVGGEITKRLVQMAEQQLGGSF